MISCENSIRPIAENTVSSGVKYRLAILASGTGSNADKICSYFTSHDCISVGLIITNNPRAGVIDVGRRHEVDTVIMPKNIWQDNEYVSHVLQRSEITHIVLAGFLLLIPLWLVEHYRDKIINIHPALLPHYGGKGMYGHHVHEKVKAAGDLYSGITIHSVDEHYDNGDIIFQEKVELDKDDSAAQIAQKVLQLEHYHYPRVIERWVRNEVMEAF
jgi:phosphoribosylglycinamide formyltransferase-1